MRKYKVAPWCNWPNHDYARKLEELFITGARCDVWRRFMNSATLHRLHRVKGYIIHFNQYDYFDQLICEFPCTEKQLRRTITKLMRPGHEQPIVFKRTDIYDSRGWCTLPLNCFADCANAFNPRTDKERSQSDALKLNEMPTIMFGLRAMPWHITSDMFTLTHRLKDGERLAEMTFAHPDLDRRFENKRWVADKKFSKEATREQMHADLLAHVRLECAKHSVRIVDLDAIDRLTGNDVPTHNPTKP